MAAGDEEKKASGPRYPEANPDKGLSSAEAKRRLQEGGYNEVAEKKPNPAVVFLRMFWGVTPGMLEFTALLTLALNRVLETVLVLALLVFNAILGFVEGQRSESAVEALQQRLLVKARVKRDGEWIVVPARELVDGDVVRVRAGDIAPADVLVFEGTLSVDQSALTGESLAVSRGVNQKVYAGAVIARGEATGHVVATAERTYFGKTVMLVRLAKPKPHTTEATGRVARWMVIVAALGSAFALIGALVKGQELLELVPLVALLIVAAVPIALPTMFAISTTVGSLELARQSVLVTRLSATEEASLMTVLCVDKTGTITENRLTVREVRPLIGFTKEEVLLIGRLASREADQDPIDLAFIAEAGRAGIGISPYVRTAFTPFEPRLRRTEAMIVGTEGKFVATKGAVDTILGLSSPPEEVKRLVVQTQFELSAEGLRVLAVGRAFAGKYEVIGIVGLMDPPQPGVRERLTGLRRLGVGVKMLTGDALPIARQVAGEVGLGHAVTRMSEIHQVKDEADVGRMIQAADGLAEILPEDKYLVVKSMQATGEVVGMTGDGVNDAPALRQADVGIAVAGATDIARRSAGVILEEKGLKGMLALVRVGRSVFQRVMTWILNKVAKTIEVIVFVVLSFLFSGTYSTSITGIITYLLLTDFVTLSISSDRVKPSAKPDSWRLPGVLGTGLVIGVATVAESIVLLYLLQMWFPASESQYGMYVFDILTLSALLNLVVVRERSRAWSSAPSGTLGISLILDIALVVAISTFGLADLEGVPLQATLLVLGYFALMAFAVNDTLKAIAFKRYGLARAPPLKEAQE